MSSSVEISKSLVLINALSSVGTRVLRIGVLLWLHQYLLTRLDAAEYAPYPVIVSFVLFLQIAMSILTGGIARYVTDAYAKGERERVTSIISSMMPMIMWGALAFLALGGVAAWNVDVILKIEPRLVTDARWMMALLVGSNAVALILAPFAIGLHVRQKFTWINLVVLGQEMLQLGILCALLFGVSTSVLWVVVATAVGTVGHAVVCALLSRRLMPELRYDRASVKPEARRELTRFGAWMMLGNLVYRIRTNVDAIILNRFSDASEVAAFHVGSLPDRQMNQFVTIASGVIQPVLTAMNATQQDEAMRSTYLRGNRYYLWMTLAVAVPLVAFAYELVTLYVGEIYLSAALVAIVIYSSYPVTYGAEMLYRVAVAKAQIGAYTMITVAASLAKIGLSLWLIGVAELGAIGAALSTVVVAVVFQVFLLWPLGLRMLKLSFARYTRETLVPGMLPAVVAVGACLGLREVLPGVSWSVVFLNIALGSLTYLFAMFLCLQPQDRADFGRILKRVRSAFGKRSRTNQE